MMGLTLISLFTLYCCQLVALLDLTASERAHFYESSK